MSVTGRSLTTRLCYASDVSDSGSRSTRSVLSPKLSAGTPALSVPCGFSKAGMPMGLQIVGRPFAEEMVLRVAHAYEQATEWHNRRAPI